MNTTKLINIHDVRVWDTVEHQGKLMTVGINDLKYGEFMGLTLFGDSYALGHKPVKLVTLEGLRGMK